MKARFKLPIGLASLMMPPGDPRLPHDLAAEWVPRSGGGITVALKVVCADKNKKCAPADLAVKRWLVTPYVANPSHLIGAAAVIIMGGSFAARLPCGCRILNRPMRGVSHTVCGQPIRRGMRAVAAISLFYNRRLALSVRCNAARRGYNSRYVPRELRLCRLRRLDRRQLQLRRMDTIANRRFVGVP